MCCQNFQSMNHVSQQPGCQPQSLKRGHTNKKEWMRGGLQGGETKGVKRDMEELDGWMDGWMDDYKNEMMIV